LVRRRLPLRGGEILHPGEARRRYVVLTPAGATVTILLAGIDTQHATPQNSALFRRYGS
jgi:hypothetical protein